MADFEDQNGKVIDGRLKLRGVSSMPPICSVAAVVLPEGENDPLHFEINTEKPLLKAIYPSRDFPVVGHLGF